MMKSELIMKNNDKKNIYKKQHKKQQQRTKSIIWKEKYLRFMVYI